MQLEPLALSEVSHKPFGLYFFNALVVLLIIYVQFQNILGVPIRETMPQVSHLVFLLDKVLLFSLFIVFIYVRFLGDLLTSKNQATKKGLSFVAPLKSELILFTSLIIFGLWCLISAGVNQNNLEPTIFGTFAYIVYFLVFFVFSSILYKRGLIEKNYRLLLNFALLLSVLSIFQEILSLIYPASVNWWPNIQSGSSMWRMGLFRAPSLLGHPNGIGIFALFFWTVEIAKARETGLRTNLHKLVVLGAAIVFSVSRTAISAAFIAPFLVVPRFRKMTILLIPVIVLVGMLFYPYLKGSEVESSADVFGYDQYRKFALERSLAICKDHPIFGVGAGMYGGHISIRFNSPLYTRYGFTGPFYDYLHDRVGSIEQQWAQALAELGVGGVLLLVGLIFTPYFILKRLNKEERDSFFRALEAGLMVMPFQMIIYMTSFTITQQQQWLIPYFAFVGMLVGAQRCKIYKMKASL